MIHQVRVIYGDTDQLGVVYYANYLRYFESARAGFFRALGSGQADLDRWGVALPVVEAQVRYRQPARYEDLLDVEVTVTEVKGASLRFSYLVRRADQLLCEGETRHGCVDGRMRPTRLPAELRALLVRDPCRSALSPQL